MNGCRFEPHVLAAIADDRWTDALREHVATCDECAACAAAGPWMLELARVDEREHALPDPSILWLKAQLLRSTATVDKIARPITSVQMAAYLVVAACWAAMLTWKWNTLQAWMDSLTPRHLLMGTAAASATGTASLSMTFIVGFVVLASATVMVALHTILAED